MKLSIIIPILNEEKNIPILLLPLQKLRAEGHEIILVDGGSYDKSTDLAENLVDKICVSKPGRAKQQNRGVEYANGDYLLFLHADTSLPETVVSDLSFIKALSKNTPKQYIWGRFKVRLSGEQFIFRVIERMMNWRSCATGIVTGDQTLFIESKFFKLIDGFPDIELMEDIAISKKLKKFSKPYCFNSQVITSSRRWEEKGIIRTILFMWWNRLSYFFGVSPKKLQQKYYSN